MKRIHIFIYGHIQGVFFRANIKELALRLKINGWVRNTLDGAVEAVFEGEDKDIEKMLSYCNKGPVGSKVEKVNVKEEEVKYEKGFEVK
ncbi:MAG TPA: acylphosphatase [Candidatus Nanoarchaeia archaeon]|nr:acylphosphatase [Candidatus Nanoarchaeia archaeon]